MDLEFITTASEGEEGYKISGIPDKLWKVFAQACEDAMPEKGKLAWASVLTEIIQKHVEGNTYTYIMTDIPQEARVKFERAAGQADLSMDHIIGVMFKCAMEEHLHIVNMVDPESTKEGYITLVVAGLSQPAWQKWGDVAKTAGMFPEELIGHMFAAASSGNISLDPVDTDDHNATFGNGRYAGPDVDKV